MQVDLKNVLKETPKVVRRIRSVVIYTIAGSLPFAKILSEKVGVTVEDYAMYAGFAMLLTRAFSMLFGVTEDDAGVDKAPYSAPKDETLN